MMRIRKIKNYLYQSSQISATHWLLLAMGSLLVASNYYCYDIPASIGGPLQKWMGSTHEDFQWQINILYSVYAFPNIFIPLVGGILVDKIGPTYMLLIFVALVCIGQTIFSIGLTFKSFWMMVVGRFVFGLGGESLEVAQSKITTDWFKGRGLGMALGFNLSFARIATALNDNISPWIEKNSSVPVAGWFGFGVCIMSFLFGLGIIYIDRAESRRAHGIPTLDETKQSRHKEITSIVESNEHTSLLNADSNNTSSYSGTSMSNTMSGNVDSVSTQRPTLSLVVPSTEPITNIEAGYESEEYDEDDETVHFSQIFSLGWSFWLLCLTCILTYGAAVPFFHICTEFFHIKWGLDAQTAGFVMSVPDWVSAFGSPLCGVILDYIGLRGVILPFSCIILLASHAILQFSDITPIFGMTIMGVAYSIFASALWPCVSYLVGPHQIATGYGLMTISLNFSLFLFPLIVAQIRNLSESTDYTYTQYFFMFLCLLSMLASTALVLSDIAQGSVLNSTSTEPLPARVSTPIPRPRTPFDELAFTTKVIGDGVVVAVPSTVIHHHHHRPLASPSTRSRSEDVDRDHVESCDCGGQNDRIVSGSVSPVKRRIHLRDPE